MDRVPAPPAIAETHISVLVFVGERAYKLKKPVRFAFLDFSTPEKRRAACEREVELNRRLAPDVYLGVAELHGPADPETGIEPPPEPLVVMRRLADDRRLATLARDGDPRAEAAIPALAHLLAAFHDAARSGPELDAAATRDAVLARWEENIAEIEPFVGSVLDAAEVRRTWALARVFLAGRAPLFASRIAQGRIRDGHGDLQAADVFCLDDGPRVLDCIEFDDRLRFVDVVDDVAFLAMDLERLGAPALAAALLDRYRDLADDQAPTALVDHYVAYRAQVRAKVEALRSAQEEPGTDEHTAAVEASRSLLGLARRHLEAAVVRLVVVGGPPGSGKSTLAAGLGDRLGAVVLRADEIRKEAAGLDPTAPAGAPFGEGLYRPEVTDATYDELVRRAGVLLGLGRPVVLDASWSSARHRAVAREVAASAAAVLTELACEVAPDVAAARMVARREAGGDASDATPEIAERLRAATDPWPEATSVRTDRPVAETLAEAVAETLGRTELRR